MPAAIVSGMTRINAGLTVGAVLTALLAIYAASGSSAAAEPEPGSPAAEAQAAAACRSYLQPAAQRQGVTLGRDSVEYDPEKRAYAVAVAPSDPVDFAGCIVQWDGSAYRVLSAL